MPEAEGPQPGPPKAARCTPRADRVRRTAPAGSAPPEAAGAAESPEAPGGSDLAGVEAGLDALETPAEARRPGGRAVPGTVLPPLAAAAVLLSVWQSAYLLQLKPRRLLPGPLDVGHALHLMWVHGTLLGSVWTSVSRGVLGYAAAVLVGTPLGLLTARLAPVRTVVGPLLAPLQAMPSVAWVPAAVLWFGVGESAIYAVVLLGAVPSIAGGLVTGLDQVPAQYPRAGRVLGATGLRGLRHVLLPAALPGYLAGLRQGWAFSWRSLMAGEIIGSSPRLGTGLGRLLQISRAHADMPGLIAALLLILAVGVGIESTVFGPLERRVLRGRGLLAGVR